MFKKILFLLSFLFLFSGQAFAFKAETFVSFSHLVVGNDNWKNQKFDSLTIPKIVYQESTASSSINTWFLRYDAIEDSTVSAFFNNLTQIDSDQYLGGYLDLTNQLLSDSQVTNTKGKVLAHFSLEEREKIISTYMERFFKRFGFYPQAITSPFIDSHSLSYLQKKYSVLSYFVSTGNSSGISSEPGYLKSPYFPDKNNSLIPSKKLSEKINLAVTSHEELNSPDLLKLLSYYGQKNFNEFTQLNLTTSNTDQELLDIKKVRQSFDEVKKSQSKINLKYLSLAQFGDWFKARYPESTPAFFYQDNESKDRVNYLYQNPWYRVELLKDGGYYKIINLVVFNRHLYEDAYDTELNQDVLSQNLPASITESDKFTLGLKDPNLYLSYLRPTDFWSINLQNSSEKISFQNKKIVFTGVSLPPIKNSAIKVISEKNQITWNFNYGSLWENFTLSNILFWLAVLILFFFLVFKNNRPPTLGLLVLAIALSTVIKSGSLYTFGMGFWGPNGHDSIFHLSLLNHFRENTFSLNNPQYSGAVLSNYHFLFDYLSGLILRITGTPTNFFYFVIFPIFSGLILLKLISSLASNRGLNSFQKKAYIVFFFLGSSLGFIPRLISGQNIFSGESAFWSNQSVSLFLNPPFVASLILLLSFILIYSNSSSSKSRSFKDVLFLVILGSLLSQAKVYSFILLVGTLLIIGEFKLFTLIAFFGFLITKPFSQISDIPFNFDPLWFPRTMFASPDRVYLPRLSEAWSSYENSSSFIKLYLVSAFATVTFLVGNLGVRLVGLFGLLKDKNPDSVDKLLKVLIVLSIITPLLFTQTVNPWNSIQFMYYGLSFLALYTAKFLPSKIYLWLPIIVIGIFGSLGTIKDYLTHFSSSRLSYNELRALETLRQYPKGVILSPVNDRNHGFPSPKPLYDYVSTSYISALSGQPEFISDTINLDIMGVNFANRYKDVVRFYSTKDSAWASNFLRSNGIVYVYETPIQKIMLSPEQINLTKIFDSSEVKLYKLD